MKAVEYDKLPVKFKKANPFEGLLDQGYWLQKKYDGCMGIAIESDNGIVFGTGIGFRITTGIAENNAGNTGADEVTGFIAYN